MSLKQIDDRCALNDLAIALPDKIRGMLLSV